jgi:hypothetical protein
VLPLYGSEITGNGDTIPIKAMNASHDGSININHDSISLKSFIQEIIMHKVYSVIMKPIRQSFTERLN